jgi:hypothetical protein
MRKATLTPVLLVFTYLTAKFWKGSKSPKLRTSLSWDITKRMLVVLVNTNNIYRITSQKSEALNYTAAETWKLAKF